MIKKYWVYNVSDHRYYDASGSIWSFKVLDQDWIIFPNNITSTAPRGLWWHLIVVTFTGEQKYFFCTLIRIECIQQQWKENLRSFGLYTLLYWALVYQCLPTMDIVLFAWYILSIEIFFFTILKFWDKYINARLKKISFYFRMSLKHLSRVRKVCWTLVLIFK